MVKNRLALIRHFAIQVPCVYVCNKLNAVTVSMNHSASNGGRKKKTMYPS